MQTQNKPLAKPVPRPPRVVLLLEAPTNTIVASHFIHKGYSVEIVRDLKFCSTALLKSAKFIVANPNLQKSPYYDKVVKTLVKMIPERLFQQEGQELLVAIKGQVTQEVQPREKAHPQDGALHSAKRNIEDQGGADELSSNPSVSEEKILPSERKADYKGPARSESPEVKVDEDEEGETGTNAGGTTERVVDIKVSSNIHETIDKMEARQGTFALTDEIREVLAPYIEVAGQLRELDAIREMMQGEDIPDDAKSELRRQSTGIRKPLMPEKIIEKAKVLEGKAKAAQEKGVAFPPRKLPAGEAFDRVIELSEKQEELLLKRAYLRFDLAQWFSNKVADDYLFKIFRSIGLDADYFFGTVYFFLSLESVHQEVLAEYKDSHAKLSQMTGGKDEDTKKSSGFGGFFKKKEGAQKEEESASPEEISLRNKTANNGFAFIQLEQDLTKIEPDMVGSFWATMEQAGLKLLEGRVKNKSFLRQIRAFLRFGIISSKKSFIHQDQYDYLLNLCDEDNSDFKHGEGQTNIIYPDEAMLQIKEGILPPSYDEDLELTGQDSPRYRYEKILKKVYSCNFKVNIYSRESKKWKAKSTVQEEAVSSAEAMMAEKEKGTKEYKIAQASMREAKVEVARLSKISEKLNTIIETEREAKEHAMSRLGDIDYKPTDEVLVACETKNTRRFCKLLGNLKEPFLPFLLRDTFKVNEKGFYGRKELVKEIEAFEKKDCTIFSADLVNAQNPRKQVMIRYSPTIISMPCLGTMGFSVGPCGSTDTGRLVAPLMTSSQTPMEAILTDIFADFNYDTSKENAGADVMTSDTIVAAYAKVRWDYRKKGKEYREKAAIYNDMQDRKNFRYHYRLYINSIDESGKKLYFKNYEMYEAFSKYIPLPPGKERLKKG